MAERIWVVVPAAGFGRRLAGDVPKQYLPLSGRAVIEWSLAPFLAAKEIEGIVVVLAGGDRRFGSLAIANDARVRTASGGAERADSVRNGLRALSADARDWVLVHDAARPCLHADDLSKLIAELKEDEVGGLLAAPVADTLKSADSKAQVLHTVPRENLWRALTPQMFRFGVLNRALEHASERGAGTPITDESSAVERLGLKPKLVVGRSDNIKITVSEDLPYAETILRARNEQ